MNVERDADGVRGSQFGYENTELKFGLVWVWGFCGADLMYLAREGAPVGGLASGPEVINVQIRSIWPGKLQSREGRAAGPRLSPGKCPPTGRSLRGQDKGAGREPSEASCLSGFYQGFWVAPTQTAKDTNVFFPLISNSGLLCGLQIGGK